MFCRFMEGCKPYEVSHFQVMKCYWKGGPEPSLTQCFVSFSIKVTRGDSQIFHHGLKFFATISGSNFSCWNINGNYRT